MINIKIVKFDNDKEFEVKVTNENFKIIRFLIDKEKDKIIDKLKLYKNAGMIGSIFYPRNKQIQKELNNLVRKKRILTKSIEQINNIFL